jgi:hypothetical protein
MSKGWMVWLTLFLMGAYHGINPGIAWLFAVARGMQEHRARAVAWSLPPITLGHALSIGVVVLLAGLAQVVLPLTYIRIGVAVALVGLGLYKLIRSQHFHWGGMQVGFREPTIWSFLMASAHGAGLMVLPVVLAGPHAQHHAAVQGAASGLWATLIHTLGSHRDCGGVPTRLSEIRPRAAAPGVVQPGFDLGYRFSCDRLRRVIRWKSNPSGAKRYFADGVAFTPCDQRGYIFRHGTSQLTTSNIIGSL